MKQRLIDIIEKVLELRILSAGSLAFWKVSELVLVSVKDSSIFCSSHDGAELGEVWAFPGPWYCLRLSYVIAKGMGMGLSLTFGVEGMSLSVVKT